MRLKNDRLAYEILSAVAEIPCGKVATYGQIARLIGRNKNARLVGSVLRHAADYGDYPCHRVVNASGRLVPGWAAQQAVAYIKPRACLWAHTLPMNHKEFKIYV